MKKLLFAPLTLGLIIGILYTTASFKSWQEQNDRSDYIVIVWNDLGMHCANKDFQNLAILPPYNNIYAHVIKRGDEDNLPELITDGIELSYSIPGNSYSVGKTNFWDYAFDLFGVNLPDDIGLTGVGLTGTMESTENYFHVEGVPITPFQDDDLEIEAPYQLGHIELWINDDLITSTDNVVPVSNEIGCVSSDCHSSEADILNEHEDEGGFDPNDTPILCAECHASNALGTTGDPEAGPLSYVIHEKHGEYTNDCYKCHPGDQAQCHRGIMFTKGLECQDCHGSVTEVAESIEDGREPWLEEPQCGATDCHGSNYAEEPGKLFRQSKGHGGLFCSTCHGEPHAIVPSTVENDNVQNIALQGYAGILQECNVCHGISPSGAGPHGIYSAVTENITPQSDGFKLFDNYPNPALEKTTFSFSISKSGKVYLNLFSISGRQVGTIVNDILTGGTYQVVFNTSDLSPGVYYYRLEADEKSVSKKLIVH